MIFNTFDEFLIWIEHRFLLRHLTTLVVIYLQTLFILGNDQLLHDCFMTILQPEVENLQLDCNVAHEGHQEAIVNYHTDGCKVMDDVVNKSKDSAIY